MSQAPALPTADVLAGWVTDARRRTLELIDDLDDEQLLGPRLAIVNPLLWEIGHVAWFQEKWVLRHARDEPPAAPRRRRAVRLRRRRPRHALGPAAAVARRRRSRYLAEVRDARRSSACARRRRRATTLYFALLAVFHEDMHGEAFTYTRQTLGYPAPRLSGATRRQRDGAARWPGDVRGPRRHLPAGRRARRAVRLRQREVGAPRRACAPSPSPGRR